MTSSRSADNVAVVGFCPVSGQGRQLVARENSTKRLFIYCNESEADWDSPSGAKEVQTRPGELRV